MGSTLAQVRSVTSLALRPCVLCVSALIFLIGGARGGLCCLLVDVCGIPLSIPPGGRAIAI